MSLTEIIAAIRKYWLIVVVLTIVGTVGGLVYGLRATPLYRSSVTFFVSTPSTDDAAALESDQFASRRVNSYVHLLSSDAMAKVIIADTGVKLAPRALAGEITGSADLNTVLLKASVVDESKTRAFTIASAIANRFSTLVREVDAQAQTSRTDNYAIQLRVVSGPYVLGSPISPNKKLDLGIGLVLGLLIGVLLAVVRELGDTSIRGVGDVRETTQLPVLGVVSYERAARKSPILLEGRVNARAEAMRKVRTNLQFAGVDDRVEVVAITSSVAGEGKTSTALNLAIVSAEAGKRVLLIDCDLRRPRVAAYAGLEDVLGLTDVLTGRSQVNDVLSVWGSHGLQIITAGSIPPNPSELLSSKAMARVIVHVRRRFDMVILDTPPLNAVTDAAVLTTAADGFVLVVRDKKVNRSSVLSSLSSLSAVDARVVGTVVTTSAKRFARRGYSTYGESSSSRWNVVAFNRRKPDLEPAEVAPADDITAPVEPMKVVEGQPEPKV